MKCSRPTCNHNIGLVSYRRGFFGQVALLLEEMPRHLGGRARRAASVETPARRDLLRMAVRAADRAAAARTGRGARQKVVAPF